MQDTNGDEDFNDECVAYKRARRPKELGDLPKMGGERVSKL